MGAVDMVRFGLGIRALRIRRGWRQKDLAAAAGVSQSVVARIERGQGGRVAVDKLAAVARPLGARVDVRLLYQGEAMDRLLDQEHAGLVEIVARTLRGAGWDVRTEVTFWIRGERGSVDVLAWHAGERIVIVIEVKSVVPDVQATLATLDRKARLGPEIAKSVGWRPVAVGRLLVIGASRTARRRVAVHRATFEAALPDRFVAVRRYLARPHLDPVLRGLMFVTGSHHLTTRHRQPGRRASPERAPRPKAGGRDVIRSPPDSVAARQRRVVTG
jgi:transcriptional regulator with XRE-family HTH domain